MVTKLNNQYLTFRDLNKHPKLNLNTKIRIKLPNGEFADPEQITIMSIPGKRTQGEEFLCLECFQNQY